MKSKLNKHGVYTNNTIIEVDCGKGHIIKITLANCDDGYRATCGFDWWNWTTGSPCSKWITPRLKDCDAIIDAIQRTMDDVKNEFYMKEQSKEILPHLQKLYKEYYNCKFNQLELF